jgi:hypothetical protein
VAILRQSLRLRLREWGVRDRRDARHVRDRKDGARCRRLIGDDCGRSPLERYDRAALDVLGRTLL